MDWWLSPELYLRRPPSKNERYRVDNMLKAAAERASRSTLSSTRRSRPLSPATPRYIPWPIYRQSPSAWGAS